MEHLVEAFNQLGVGLSKVLRYSFPGIAAVIVAARLDPADVGIIKGAIGWEWIALGAVVIGVGLYAAHRSLVVPMHHLGLCFLLWLWETCSDVDAKDSTSPTRWLGSERIGVKRFRRFLAYNALRRSDFFKDKQELDVAHAENGLVLMLFEIFLGAALFTWAIPDKSDGLLGLLFVLAGIALIATYPRAAEDHRQECLRIRARESEARRILLEYGILLD